VIKLIIKACITGIVALILFGCISIISSSMNQWDFYGGFIVGWIILFVFSLFLG